MLLYKQADRSNGWIREMMKGFVYAIAAALVSFAAVTWATHMVTDQPNMAFASAGSEPEATQDASASLLQERAEHERVISEQRQHIETLQSELNNAKVAGAENTETPARSKERAEHESIVSEQRQHIETLQSELEHTKAAGADATEVAAWDRERDGQKRIISEQLQHIHALESELNNARSAKVDTAEAGAQVQERAKLAASNTDLWREVQSLEGAVANYQNQLGGAAQQRAREISQLQAEIDLRDQNIVSLMRQLTTTQLNARRNHSSSGRSLSQLKPLTAIPVSPVSLPTHDAAKISGTSSGAFSQTLEDGKQAYRTGRYETAFDIWLQLAEQGDSQAQFHVGALYFEGRGVEKDFKKSRAWLTRAQQNGEHRAKAMLDRVNSKARKTGTVIKSKS